MAASSVVRPVRCGFWKREMASSRPMDMSTGAVSQGMLSRPQMPPQRLMEREVTHAGVALGLRWPRLRAGIR